MGRRCLLFVLAETKIGAELHIIDLVRVAEQRLYDSPPK
jgi:hypothetical protein